MNTNCFLPSLTHTPTCYPPPSLVQYLFTPHGLDVHVLAFFFSTVLNFQNSVLLYIYPAVPSCLCPTTTRHPFENLSNSDAKHTHRPGRAYIGTIADSWKFLVLANLCCRFANFYLLPISLYVIGPPNMSYADFHCGERPSMQDLLDRNGPQEKLPGCQGDLTVFLPAPQNASDRGCRLALPAQRQATSHELQEPEASLTS
ncbi:hypothetical protein GE21DRAFT_1036804 [Neurospora crassa]|nr:hypothetical protein GE21DRAFT_1036804 [Neurospora crassa]